MRSCRQPASPPARVACELPSAPPITPAEHDATQPAPARLRLLQTGWLIATLDRTLPLPNTPRAFFNYFIVLLLIAAGMSLHVVLAVQTLQARLEVQRLHEEYENLRNQNSELIWEIARKTNLDNIQQLAYAAGYRPIQKRQYVPMPASAGFGAQPAGTAQREPQGAAPNVALRRAGAAVTPMPEGRELSQWWQPWQERIETTAAQLLERILGS